MEIMKRLPCVAVVLLFVLPITAQTDGRDVDIQAKDGTLLKATIYPAESSGHGILLLYNCQSDNHRGRFTGLAGKLAAAGFHAMTLDYRGYGDSGDDARGFEAQLPHRMTKWREDMIAAYNWLAEQEGVLSETIGLVGAGCGTNQGLHLSRDLGMVGSFVFLEGRGDEEGKAHISAATHIPVLTVVGDPLHLSGEVSQELWHRSNNPDKEMIVYNRGGHGVDALERHPELGSRIADWFKNTLVRNNEE